MTSATGAVNDTKVFINFSQPVWCDAANGFAPGDFKLQSFQTGVTDPTFTAVDVANNKCGGTQQTTGTPLVLDTSTALPSNTTYTLTFTQPANTSGAVKNVFNVALASGSAITFTTGAADITPPVITDADLTGKSAVSTNFEHSGDAFTLTFSKKMNSSWTWRRPSYQPCRWARMRPISVSSDCRSSCLLMPSRNSISARPAHSEGIRSTSPLSRSSRTRRPRATRRTSSARLTVSSSIHPRLAVEPRPRRLAIPDRGPHGAPVLFCVRVGRLSRWSGGGEATHTLM